MLISGAGAVPDFYWEAPVQLSRLQGAYPQALRSGDSVVAIWQENQASGEGGNAWLSAISYGPDGEKRLDRFAGPFPYQGTPPVLFSANVDGQGVIALAVSVSERRVAVYRSFDGGLSFGDPALLDMDQVAVSPRIFPLAGGGWQLFMTRGEADALSIQYVRSDDGLSWSGFQPFVEPASGLRLNFLPAAATLDGADIMVFQSLAGGERPSFQLYSRVSVDGGRNWSAPALVTDFLDPVQRTRTSSGDFGNERPHLSVIGGELWLAWERRVLSGPAQAYVAKMNSAGRVEPGSVERVSLGQGACSEPRLFDVDGIPGLTWFDDRSGTTRVYLSIKDGFLWRERDLSVRTRGEAAFGRAVYRDGSVWAFWQLGREASTQVIGMAPDISVRAPVLSAADFREGVAVARDRASFSWTVPQDSSGISGFSYLWSRSPEAAPPLSVMVLENVTRSAQNADQDGTWYFSVRAQDYAGNWSEPARLSFLRDTTPPAMPVALAPLAGEDGFLASNSFRLRWQPPEDLDLAGYSWLLEYLGPLDRLPARRLAASSAAPAAAVTAPGAAGTDSAAGAPETQTQAADSQEAYAFSPASAYEERLWNAREPGYPAPTLRTRNAYADFTNIDDGYWAFSVAAIDATGNMGEAARIMLRADKFIPFTAVTDVIAARDDFGALRLRVLGRGFLEDGPITRLVIDADGREPYDRVFELSAREFTIRSDRLIEGAEAADLPAGDYRVGLYHPQRRWYFTGPSLNVDVSGTVKFGDYGAPWKPSWTFIDAARPRLTIALLFMILALAFPLVGIILSMRQVAIVVREGAELRLDALALLEGKPMPTQERERAVKAAIRKGSGLTAKFISTISFLVLFVVALVSIPIGLQTIQSQSEILAKGLEQRVRVLLESAAQGGRSYLPVRNQLELATLPNQAQALDEALYLSISGYGLTRRTEPDIVWASNDPDILNKIDGPELRLGESALKDELSPQLPGIAAAIDEKAAAEVSAIAEELQRLQDEALSLATRLDAASQERVAELSSSSVGLQRELNQRLAAIADASVASVPPFDPKALEGSAKDYIFYKPILYRQGREPAYYRGMVRVAVSTELIVAEVLRSRDILVRNVSIVAAIALAIGILGAVILSGIIINPVRRLVKGIEHIRDTADKKDLADFTIDVKSRDEIGVLAHTINDMTMGLVVAAKEAEFLTVGKETQKMFIPLELNTATGEKMTTGFEENPTHDFFGYYEGAKGVSGDYFDYRKLDDQYWAFIKCDVAGKGIPAALIMVGVATIFSSEFQGWSFKRDGIHLDRLAYKINDFLYRRGFKGRFAALLMGVYDAKTGAVYVCHAGDNMLYIYSAAGRRLIEHKLDESPAAGPMDNDLVEMKAPYKQVIKKLDIGDALVLFTDGFEESSRLRRKPDFSQVMVKKSTRDREGNETFHDEPAVEAIGQERINAAVEAIMNGGRFSFSKEDDPLGPDTRYDFDFSSMHGTPAELVLGLTAIEKVFRMVPDPRAGDEDMVLVDSKIDAVLERCFLQYGSYCRNRMDHPDKRRSEYKYYRRLKEDDQYDDLTMMVIQRKT
jgi:hypothetical protein